MLRPSAVLLALAASLLMGCGSGGDDRSAASDESKPAPEAEPLAEPTPSLPASPQAESPTPPEELPRTEETESVGKRKLSPLGKVVALADISNDSAWKSEEFAELAGSQLKKIAAVLAREAGAEELGRIQAPGFKASPLFAATGPAFTDHSFTVARAAQFPEATPTDLAGAVTQFARYLEGAVRTKFKISRVGPGEQSYSASALAGFAADGREINAVWETEWVPSSDGEKPLLQSIRVVEFEEVKRTVAQPLFADCTEAVIGDTPAYQEQLVYGAPHWHGNLDVAFGIFQGNQGLAIGDADGDGLEDLYLCQPDGLPNRFFLRNPDGTLREHTTDSGVDLLDVSRSPLFVDFDNDGDQDLAISHRFAVSIFENDGRGRFTLGMTFQAESRTSGLAAADFDHDGDLDLFVCGYSPQSQTSPEDIFANPVPYEDARNGAYNYLLRNDGGFAFTDATAGSGLDQNNTLYSFAAAWEDYDNDGDQDLYVANDFGRNNLYRNELVPSGQATFTDVAEALGVLDVAAGMSADWGDADNDGRMDIYVSNMWSSAGNRIAFQNQFKREADAGTRSLIQRHARGNSLFLNRAGGFDDVSVSSNVNMGRWAWGSLFVDFNNDGWEDFYIANGFMTAPATGDL